MIKLAQLLNESDNAAAEAHKLDLVSAGWGYWKDSTGKTVAKTVQGKLVKLDDTPSPEHGMDREEFRSADRNSRTNHSAYASHYGFKMPDGGRNKRAFNSDELGKPLNNFHPKTVKLGDKLIQKFGNPTDTSNKFDSLMRRKYGRFNDPPREYEEISDYLADKASEYERENLERE